MNYFLINFLTLIKTSIKFKRKIIEDEANTKHNKPDQIIHYSLKNKSSGFELNNFHSTINISKFNQQNKKSRKVENINDDFKQLSDFLDSIEFQEPSKDDLDRCIPVDMNIEDLDKLLDLKNETNFEKTIDIEETSEKRQSDSLQCFPDAVNESKIKFLHGFITRNTIESNDSLNLETKNILNPRIFKTDEINAYDFREHRKKLKFYILAYIKNNIKTTYRTGYTAILSDLEKACDYLEKHQFNETKYNFIFSPLYDLKLYEVLKTFNSKFNKTSKFNQKACDNFMTEFKSYVLENYEILKPKYALDLLDKNEKKTFFYSEISRLYKYIADLPEILTLCRLYSISSFTRIIIILHSINLFASKVGCFKDNNVFILSMIYVAFQIFHEKNNFDLFMFLNYELVCFSSKQRHNLYFFLWDLNLNRLKNIKLRNVSVFVNDSMDAIYLRVNFMIFLYQHFLFMKCFNVKVAYLNSFKMFIDEVKQNNMCFGCQFNEYLHRTQIFVREKF